jgi:hypothetical protein
MLIAPARVALLFPLLLCAPTVLLAVWVIVTWNFNGLYGQDPFAYYDYGVGPLRHSLLAGAPVTAMFWPLGYPSLITLASLVTGPVTAAGQAVNVLAGAAAVCFTYLLGRDVLLQAGADLRTSRRAAGLAAVLFGLTGRLLESNVLIMADSVAVATAVLSAWTLVRWTMSLEEDALTSSGRSGWLALSAAALAWSVVTRWGQAALIVPWLVAIVPVLRTRRAALWRALPWAIVPAVAILGAQLWFVFTVRPEANLGNLPFAGDLGLVNGSGSSWSLLHFFQHSFVNADGVERYTLPNALFYATGPFLPQYLTLLFLPAVAVGLVGATSRYRRSLLLLVAWPAVLLLFDAGLAEQNPRFIQAALPPIAILAGLGLVVILERLKSRSQLVAGAVVAGCLLFVAATGLRELSDLNRARRADLQVAQWAAARIPPHGVAVSFGITLTLQHATTLHVVDLSVLTATDLRKLSTRRRPAFLLIQMGAVNGQFAGQAPGIDFRILRDHPGLGWLGALHGYTLFRVGSANQKAALVSPATPPGTIAV